MQGFAVLPTHIARDPSIDPPLKALLLALSSFAGADQTCFPSNRTLQDCTGLSERTVRDWLRVGETKGLLLTHRRVGPDGAPTSNLYELNFAKWSNPLARQNLPGVPAKSAGGWGDAPPQGGATGRPRWGDGLPPNNTNEHDQGNETKTPLPSVATPADGLLLDVPAEPAKRKATLAQKPPTLAETVGIFRGLGAADPDGLADACLTYWQSAGFRRKAGPVVDWPATCRTWHLNAKGRGDRGQPARGNAPIERWGDVAAADLVDDTVAGWQAAGER